MAQRTFIELVDDLDGSAAAETVSFGLDGSSFEIDLSEGHAADLREALGVYVGAGRRAAGSRRTARTKASPPAARPAGNAEPQAIRAWAVDRGLPVSPRGRLAADIVEQYRAAVGH